MSHEHIRTSTRDVVAELKGVSKYFGKHRALESVNLQVRRGEVLALLGPNGAGKTTAISLLLGLLRASSGKVELFAKNPRLASNRDNVGVMLQLSGVPETNTVQEHIQLFRSYYAEPMGLEDCLNAAQLSGLEHRLYGKLSGGQKQRLHLALALCGNPDLLFLDEPTTGLDVASRQVLWQQIRQLIEAGKTVVLTTHYLEEADALADRIAVIHQGEIIADDTPASIKSKTASKKIRCRTTTPKEEISALPEVVSLREEGGVLIILCHAAEPVVSFLLRDPQLSDLEVTGAGLDEAFLSLTQGA